MLERSSNLDLCGSGNSKYGTSPRECSGVHILLPQNNGLRSLFLVEKNAMRRDASVTLRMYVLYTVRVLQTRHASTYRGPF